MNGVKVQLGVERTLYIYMPIHSLFIWAGAKTFMRSSGRLQSGAEDGGGVFG